MIPPWQKDSFLNYAYLEILPSVLFSPHPLLQWTSLLENKNQLQKNDYLQRLIKKVAVSWHKSCLISQWLFWRDFCPESNWDKSQYEFPVSKKEKRYRDNCYINFWNWKNNGAFFLIFYLLVSTLQMFTGIYRDSTGGFLHYLQGKPCNIYRLQRDCRDNL